MVEQNVSSLPAVISVTQMAELLQLSRSRLYQCLDGGIFLKPIYTTDTHRAYYTAEMAEKNLEVRRSNVGINKKICLFYRQRQEPMTRTTRKPPAPTPASEKPAVGSLTPILDGLRDLGLTAVNQQQVKQIISECYPDGIDEHPDFGEVIRTAYLSIKRRNTSDNVG